jgi:hypothetical protein
MYGHQTFHAVDIYLLETYKNVYLEKKNNLAKNCIQNAYYLKLRPKKNMCVYGHSTDPNFC